MNTLCGEVITQGRYDRLRLMEGLIGFRCAAASGITYWVTCLRRLKGMMPLRILACCRRICEGVCILVGRKGNPKPERRPDRL